MRYFKTNVILAKIILIFCLLIPLSGCVSIDKTLVIRPNEKKLYSNVLVLVSKDSIYPSEITDSFSEFKTLSIIQGAILSKNKDDETYSEGKKTWTPEKELFSDSIFESFKDGKKSTNFLKINELNLKLPLISREENSKYYKNLALNKKQKKIFPIYKKTIDENNLGAFLFIDLRSGSVGTPVTSGTINISGNHGSFESSTSMEYGEMGYLVGAKVYDAVSEKVVWESSYFYYGGSKPYRSFADVILKDLYIEGIIK